MMGSKNRQIDRQREWQTDTWTYRQKDRYTQRKFQNQKVYYYYYTKAHTVLC